MANNLINTKFKVGTRIVFVNDETGELSDAYYVISSETYSKLTSEGSLRSLIANCHKSYGCKPILVSYKKEATSKTLGYLRENRNYMVYNKTVKLLYEAKNEKS